MDMLTRLVRIPLFAHVSAPRLRQLARATKLVHAPKGTALFRQDEAAEWVWVVLHGWVHLVRTPDPHTPQTVVIFTVTPNDALCGISAIEPGTYVTGGIAGSDVEVLRLSRQAFQDALIHDASFAHDVLHLFAQRIRRIAQQYGTMVYPVSQRIIRTILRLRDQFGPTLPITHRELAQMSWTTTESAIRTVGRLKRSGYVSGSRGRLRVHSPARLEALLQPANGDPRSL